MKILSITLLALLFIGCETPNQNLETEKEVETSQVELVFNTVESPFDEMVQLSPQCYEDDFISENADLIVLAKVIEVNEISRLQVVDWIKGEPIDSSDQISFDNTVSTSPSFDENKYYQIYITKNNDLYHTTCHDLGIQEIQIYDEGGLE